jgi:SAM-dependent methyltransferase
MTKNEVLQKCTIDGLIVKLPNVQLDRKLYMEVAKALELIGGKWKGGKISGFVFLEDPSDLLYEIANGEKRNLKKEYQFFETPSELADELVKLADIKSFDDVLEPSAGQGAIVKAIQQKIKNKIVYGFELMDINKTFLDKISNFRLLGDDFLSSEKYNFDKIVANPPFSNNQDIIHIRKMYDFLRDGGRLVSIASSHWILSKNKKEIEFKQWLEDVKAEIINIPSGTFKKSGTMVGGVIIIINK